MKVEEFANSTKLYVDDLLYNSPIKVRKPKRPNLDSVLFD